MTTYAMNLKSNATTEYGGFDFNSMALAHDGNYYAIGSSGLVKLGGDTDAGAPIEAMAGLGQTDLGTDKKKRLRAIYAGAQSVESVLVRIECEGDHYEVPALSASEVLQQQRIDPPRGLRANVFGFDIYNQGGSSLRLSSFEVVSSASATRRIGS
jgi:hypothetical protein